MASANQKAAFWCQLLVFNCLCHLVLNYGLAWLGFLWLPRQDVWITNYSGVLYTSWIWISYNSFSLWFLLFFESKSSLRDCLYTEGFLSLRSLPLWGIWTWSDHNTCSTISIQNAFSTIYMWSFWPLRHTFTVFWCFKFIRLACPLAKNPYQFRSLQTLSNGIKYDDTKPKLTDLMFEWCLTY